MQADHEVVIGRHRVQADLVGRPHAAHTGKVIRQPAFDRGLLRVVDPPIHREWIGDDLAAGVLGELEPAAVELRKAVEEAARRVERTVSSCRALNPNPPASNSHSIAPPTAILPAPVGSASANESSRSAHRPKMSSHISTLDAAVAALSITAPGGEEPDRRPEKRARAAVAADSERERARVHSDMQ